MFHKRAWWTHTQTPVDRKNTTSKRYSLRSKQKQMAKMTAVFGFCVFSSLLASMGYLMSESSLKKTVVVQFNPLEEKGDSYLFHGD